MGYTMHIFCLTLFAGTVLSTTIGQVFVAQTKLVGYLESETEGSMEHKSAYTVETSTQLSDEKYDDDCICTPFHMCKTYEAAHDGHELIDIRINAAPCQSYLDVCCNDTKITSTENYKPSSPDIANSNCGCVEPEEYTKEPHTGHIDITKKPCESHKEDTSKESYVGQKEDHTKESYVGQKEDYTKKPYSGQTEDYTKEAYVGHKEDHTKESYVGQKEDYTKKPYSGQTEDYTKESYVGHKEDHTKESYVGQKEDCTKKPYSGQTEDYTKESYVSHKEDHTKESYVGQKEDYTKKPYASPTEDYTKESYVGHKEDHTKESYVGQKEDHTKESYFGQKEDYTKKPFEGHTEDYTKESYVGHKEDHTKESYVGHKEDHTKESYVGHKEDHTKESYVGHKEDHTKKPFDGHTEDYTKESFVGHKEDHTKESYVGQKEDHTKESYVGEKEDHTKDPHVGQTGYSHIKEPFVDHSYVDKAITSEQTVTTEVIKTDHDHQEKHKCGAWNKYGVGFRIGNAIDSEAQFGEFPSMVAIFKEELSKDGEKKLVLHCGGSLIEKNVVLTAAHCVIKKDISTIVVRAGEWDLKTEKEVLNHQDRRVSKIVTHPDYYAGGLYNDVALIFTESSFSLQENIQLICLPSTQDIFIDDMCFSSGWGKTVSYNNYTIVKKTASGKTKETGHYQVSILKKVELPIVPRSKCMDALRATRLGPKFMLHDSFICAGGQEGKDTCKGDGGSPLMCPYKDDPEHLVQVGIVAWGISCGLANIPAAYVNVAGFTFWIKNEIEKYSSY